VTSFRPLVGDPRRELLLLRIKFADRYSKLRTRFEHANAHTSQRQVLLVRHLDQTRQHWIVKDVPSVTVIAAITVDRRLGNFLPVCGDLNMRLMVVWTYQAPRHKERQPKD
jgi:hypothetical protein